MTKRGTPSLQPYYSSIGADLLRGRKALLERFVARAAPSSESVRAFAAKGRHSPTLDVNVVGVGVGEKVTSGKRTSELSIKVLVAKKYPKGRIARSDLIPATINGLPTDVEAVGYPKKLSNGNRRRTRPVNAGVSVSPTRAFTSPNLLAGTLGLFAHLKAGSRRYLISNNHVIAFENAVPVGEAVLQPGSLDGGAPGDVIAHLAHVVSLKFDNKPNRMDAATAKIDAGITVDASIIGIGMPKGSSRPKLNSLVRKSGRTSGLTEGIVRVMNLDLLNIEYDHGMVRMDDIFAVESVGGAFSRSGDSGSAVVNDSGRVVGLLFAGTDTQSFVIPIQRILRRFKMYL